MITCVSMLRGINVGGHKKIKMADLRDLFTTLGFKNVKTYMQSGNIIFQADEGDAYSLTNRIEEKIRQVFLFSVSVLIRTPNELTANI